MKGATDDESKICVVGFSHSYHLVYAFWANSLGHRFIYAPANYPKHLSTEFFEQYYHTRNCIKFVIGVGQHPAGYPYEELRLVRKCNDPRMDKNPRSLLYYIM